MEVIEDDGLYRCVLTKQQLLGMPVCIVAVRTVGDKDHG